MGGFLRICWVVIKIYFRGGGEGCLMEGVFEYWGFVDCVYVLF